MLSMTHISNAVDDGAAVGCLLGADDGPEVIAVGSIVGSLVGSVVGS